MTARRNAALSAFVIAVMAVISGCTSAIVGAECRAPFVRCGRYCVDLTSDTLNCGACGTSCAIGCAASRCVMGDAASNPDAAAIDAGHDAGRDAGLDAPIDGGSDATPDAFVASDGGPDANDVDGAMASTGHLVLIGHDYEMRRLPMSVIVANAVLLPTRAPVRVLGYRVDATAAAVAGTDAAIAEAAASRPYAITAAPDAASVIALLDDADTFLVYAQADASDATLRSLGDTWRAALTAFLARGGVIVVLDAPTLSNAGTVQLLDAAGLFHATAISEMLSPRLIAATGRETDAVLLGAVFPYDGARHSVRVSTLDPDVIVTTGSAPVVFHRVVTH